MSHARPSRARRAPAAALAAAALLGTLPSPARAAGERLFVLSDPEKDDHGDGSLRYPVRSTNDLVPGSLDIRSFSAWNTPDGTFFEVVFARTIQKTERRPIDDGGTMLTDVARLGFYTLNVDVYVDVDRRPGSGNTLMLPGRNAEVDPADGWEKAICLTPLPREAEALLRRTYAQAGREEARATRSEDGRLTPEEKQAIQDEVGRQVAESVFFPTRVEVRGRLLRFFVPATFLGGPAKTEWGYVVASSGSEVTGRYDLGKLAGLKKETAVEPLFIMRAAPGRGASTFGGANEDDPNPPALVDLLVPPGTTQEKLLASGNLKTGQLPRLPAVVPSQVTGAAKP